MRGTDKIKEYIAAEILPNLAKYVNLRIQAAEWIKDDKTKEVHAKPHDRTPEN